MTKPSLLALGTLFLCSCANDQANKNLVFTTFTKTGLDVSSSGTNPTSAMFGYKRFEGAIVPVDPTSEQGEAHSVFAAMELNNKWTDGLDLLQVFATGDAAVNAAKEPQSLLQGLTNADGNNDDGPDTP